MSQSFISENWRTADGVPAGGYVDMLIEERPVMTISWQNGPLVVDGARQEPNGVFVETVLEAVLQRMEFYQDTKFACEENQEIIDHVRKAIAWCQERTARRQARQVEGTSEV